jgi:nicotinic acid mononucleotide adenylyltransferase
MGELAFYGGSFNPPTPAHGAIIDHLLASPFFTKVIVKPCGVRLDKPELAKRNTMRRQRVQGELQRDRDHYFLDTTGMDLGMAPTVEEWARLTAHHPHCRVHLVVGTDLFEDEGQGRCQIQRWIDGERLFREAHFFIFPRPTSAPLILPDHAFHAENFEPLDVSSSQLRAQEGWA